MICVSGHGRTHLHHRPFALCLRLTEPCDKLIKGWFDADSILPLRADFNATAAAAAVAAVTADGSEGSAHTAVARVDVDVKLAVTQSLCDDAARAAKNLQHKSLATDLGCVQCSAVQNCPYSSEEDDIIMRYTLRHHLRFLIFVLPMCVVAAFLMEETDGRLS